jgi:hypothetical protein
MLRAWLHLSPHRINFYLLIFIQWTFYDGVEEAYAAGIKDADIEKEPDMDKEEEEEGKGKKTKGKKKNPKKKKGKDEEDEEEGKGLVEDEANELAKEYDDEAEQKPDRRLFKCVVKECRLRRIGENCDPYIKFELGGNFKKEDRRHLYVVDSIFMEVISVVARHSMCKSMIE